MRVTVCELPENQRAFEHAWEQLSQHVQMQESDLIVLPEMPFAQWVPAAQNTDTESDTWERAVNQHDNWVDRLNELNSAAVLSTRPIICDGTRLNEGFIWTPHDGYQAVHHKYYLPDEAGVWERSWYSPGDGTFEVFEYNGARIGVLICTELWALDQVREYGQKNVDLIVTPRATESATLDKWTAGGRASAVAAGAFSVSANRVSTAKDNLDFGGGSWIIDPDGEIHARTSQKQPFETVKVDLKAAEEAKSTYPRYALD